MQTSLVYQLYAALYFARRCFISSRVGASLLEVDDATRLARSEASLSRMRKSSTSADEWCPATSNAAFCTGWMCIWSAAAFAALKDVGVGTKLDDGVGGFEPRAPPAAARRRSRSASMAAADVGVVDADAGMAPGIRDEVVEMGAGTVPR